MSKVTDAVIAAIKARFENGDVPDGTDFVNLITAIQEAAQDHEHSAAGGSGSGTGDAGQVKHGDTTDLGEDDHAQYLLRTEGYESVDELVTYTIGSGQDFETLLAAAAALKRLVLNEGITLEMQEEMTITETVILIEFVT